MKKVVYRDSQNRQTEVSVYEASEFITTFTGDEAPILTGPDGKIDPSLFDAVSEAESAKEISTTITFGETIAALKLIYIGSDGKAYAATFNDTYLKASVVGMTIESGVANDVKKFLVFGRIDDASFVFSGVQELYLSTNGNLTTTAPTTGHHKPVGQSLGTGSIFLQVGKTTILGGI